MINTRGLLQVPSRAVGGHPSPALVGRALGGVVKTGLFCCPVVRRQTLAFRRPSTFGPACSNSGSSDSIASEPRARRAGVFLKSIDFIDPHSPSLYQPHRLSAEATDSHNDRRTGSACTSLRVTATDGRSEFEPDLDAMDAPVDADLADELGIAIPAPYTPYRSPAPRLLHRQAVRGCPM